MSSNILLVEDSKEIHQMVGQALASFFTMNYCFSLEEAKSVLVKKSIDLILLDIELPDGNGVDFCRYLQTNYPSVAIFFLTAHDSLSEKVMGFAAGADDYITKPFEGLELKARVDAKLRKLDVIRNSASLLVWDKIEINKDSQQVKILLEGELTPIDLTALEFKLLMFFANHPEKVIDRDEILDEIWGKDVHVYSRSVDTHISKLRKKLGPLANMIESVHGAGYKFTP